MNKTFLKVLKYIGVGCIGAVVGIGALIGISKCSYNQQDHVENSTLRVEKKKMSVLDDNVAEGTYDFSPKSYTTFMNLTTGIPVAQTDNVLTESNWIGKDNRLYYDDEDYSDITNYEVYLAPKFAIGYSDGPNRYIYLTELKMHLTYFGAVDNPKNFVATLFDRTNPQSSYESGYAYMTKLYGGVVYGDEAWTPSFYEYFNYEPRTTQTAVVDYVFNKNFNYNALVQPDYPVIDEMPYAPTTGLANVNPDVTITYSYNVPSFMSNGIVFDTIVVKVKSATTYMMFNNIDGQISDMQTSNAPNFKLYVDSISYQNSANYYTAVACYRNVYNAYDNGSDTKRVDFIMIWTNPEYRHLQFFSPMDDKLPAKIMLTQANAVEGSSGYTGFVDYPTGNNDVGLGDAFNLIRTAFTAFIPILSISVIPGISIGLLMALPLITGIMIFIIWLVKR